MKRLLLALLLLLPASGCALIPGGPPSVFVAVPEEGQCGRAAWYRMGTRTASGERMDPRAMAAAHLTLPFGTLVRVENLTNGRSVIVRINDRGPYGGGRIIDLTQGAAERIDMIRAGVAEVRLTIVDGPDGVLRINC